MTVIYTLILLLLFALGHSFGFQQGGFGGTRAFGVVSSGRRSSPVGHRPETGSAIVLRAATSDEQDDANAVVEAEQLEFKDEEEKKEAVGNLLADDEWNGLSMELGELIRVAVVEDLKKNAREFLGKDDYKLGDISKEVDVRVKSEVAALRGKEEYELGDFVMAIDEFSKNVTEELTGKPYETGDLSRELDSRIKGAVANYCGKDEYEFGYVHIA